MSDPQHESKAVEEAANPLRRTLTRFSRLPLHHWLQVMLLILIGVWLGDKLKHSDLWTANRHKIYTLLNSWLPGKPHHRKTAIILITDNEYWSSELNGRNPIKRDYLAKILRKLRDEDAAVIGLDFDLRSPYPDGNIKEDPAYNCETNTLIDAIREVAASRIIVLPKTIGWGHNYAYKTESDIYDGQEFPASVQMGYIALPFDSYRVPLSIELEDNTHLRSFSQVVAVQKADDPTVWDNSSEAETLPYGRFIPASAFPIFSVADLLNGDDKVRKAVAHQVVLVGADWNVRAYSRGPKADLHDSPVGLLPGVLLHANYIEALLDGQIYHAWPEWLLITTEVLFALIVGLPFALAISFTRKLLCVLAICFGILVISYLSLSTIGAYFDCFVPAVMVIAHGIIEQVLEWRKEAKSASHQS